MVNNQSPKSSQIEQAKNRAESDIFCFSNHKIAHTASQNRCEELLDRAICWLLGAIRLVKAPKRESG